MTGNRGGLSAEAAIVTPALTVLLLFVVFTGRLVQAQHDVTQAAGAAARTVSLLRGGDAGTVATDVVAGNLTAAGVRCRELAVDATDDGLRPGGTVTVTVRCGVDLTGVAVLGLPGNRTVSATASHVIDRYRGTADVR